MSHLTIGVLGEVAEERDRQDAEWGGPAHDDTNSSSDWAAYRKKFEVRARSAANRTNMRESLVKIAALAVAEIEAIDRMHPLIRASACFNLFTRTDTSMPGRGREFFAAMRSELDHAYAKHGRDPWGRHEFYGVVAEEFEEMWAAIRADSSPEALLAEIVQVAAMCLRYWETGDRYLGAHPAIPVRSPAQEGHSPWA